MRRFMQNLDELSGLDMVALTDRVPVSGEASWPLGSSADRALVVATKTFGLKLFGWLGRSSEESGRCPAGAEPSRPDGQQDGSPSSIGF